MRVKGSKRANNRAKNHAQRLAKQQRHATAYSNGMARAAAGNFKKGKK